MLNLSLSIGPVNAQMQTDEKLSFEGIETLLNRTMVSTLTLFNGHLGAMVKYENYDNDPECDDEPCTCEIPSDMNEEI
jgi:hypothetical protein